MRATCPLLIRPRRRPNPKQPAPQPKLRPAAACVRASHSLAPSLAGAPASRGPLRSRQRALAYASQVRSMCEATPCEPSDLRSVPSSQPLDQTSDPINRRVPARVSGYFWNLAIFSPSLHIFFILTSRKAPVSIVKPGIPHEVPEKPGKFIFSVSKPDFCRARFLNKTPGFIRNDRFRKRIAARFSPK